MLKLSMDYIHKISEDVGIYRPLIRVNIRSTHFLTLTLNGILLAVRNFNATVPGGVYTDLMNNNIIGDVFYGYNDIETRWIAYQKWIYSKEFSGFF